MKLHLVETRNPLAHGTEAITICGEHIEKVQIAHAFDDVVPGQKLDPEQIGRVSPCCRKMLSENGKDEGRAPRYTGVTLLYAVCEQKNVGGEEEF